MWAPGVGPSATCHKTAFCCTTPIRANLAWARPDASEARDVGRAEPCLGRRVRARAARRPRRGGGRQGCAPFRRRAAAPCARTGTCSRSPGYWCSTRRQARSTRSTSARSWPAVDGLKGQVTVVIVTHRLSSILLRGPHRRHRPRQVGLYMEPGRICHARDGVFSRLKAAP